MLDLVNGLQIGTNASELSKLTGESSKIVPEVTSGAPDTSFQDLLLQLQNKGPQDLEQIKNLISQNTSLKNMLETATGSKDSDFLTKLLENPSDKIAQFKLI